MKKIITLSIALVAVAFAAGGCAKEETLGTKVDKAMDGAKDAADKAKEDIKTK